MDPTVIHPTTLCLAINTLMAESLGSHIDEPNEHTYTQSLAFLPHTQTTLVPLCPSPTNTNTHTHKLDVHIGGKVWSMHINNVNL